MTVCVRVFVCQDRDASLKRLRALAKTTAEKASKEKAAAAAHPLEASQRAVIRDLSLRVANLSRSNNQLKEERERAQVGIVLSLVTCRSCLWQTMQFGAAMVMTTTKCCQVIDNA